MNKKNNLKNTKSNKNAIILILITIIIMILALSIYYILSNKENTKKENKDIIPINNDLNLWNIYDAHINSIKRNMDEITIPSDNFYWWGLKNFDINDSEYKNNLNVLVSDIRNCYMEFTMDGEIYQASNPILNYRDAKNITKQDLEILRDNMTKNSTCLYRFEDYSSLLISENTIYREEFLNALDKVMAIRNNELFTKQNPSYNELLLRKYLEVSLIDNLSIWLRSEYYKLK